MNENMNMPARKARTLTLIAESSTFDKGALICDVIMIGIFLWTQLFYQMNMLFLIIPLTLVGIYLVLFCVVPEKYHFGEDALEIHHKFRKTVKIAYESVFNYDSTTKDSFINIFQSNSVKVYYTVETKKRAILCTPKDVSSFVEILKWNCPEFWEDSTKQSSLEVFFQKGN